MQASVKEFNTEDIMQKTSPKLKKLQKRLVIVPDGVEPKKNKNNLNNNKMANINDECKEITGVNQDNNTEDDNMLGNKSLKQCIKWALTKPEKNKKTTEKNITTQNKECEKKEKEWGNDIICQKDNGQWTTKLGERLVYTVLHIMGKNPRKVENKGGFEPDWETDTHIIEVKTSNWWVTGTAGEKVYGTWIKYQEIPELYGKPLLIVCVANQEYDLEYGKVKYFGENITLKTKDVLDMARSWGIEYIKFSDLVSIINQL